MVRWKCPQPANIWISGMHIPDGFLNLPVITGTYAVTVTTFGLMRRKIKAQFGEQSIPKLSLNSCCCSASEFVVAGSCLPWRRTAKDNHRHVSHRADRLAPRCANRHSLQGECHRCQAGEFPSENGRRGVSGRVNPWTTSLRQWEVLRC